MSVLITMYRYMPLLFKKDPPVIFHHDRQGLVEKLTLVNLSVMLFPTSKLRNPLIASNEYILQCLQKDTIFLVCVADHNNGILLFH